MKENQPLSIIVAGANGRMGRMLCDLIRKDPQFKLAGALDLKDHLKELTHLDCPVSESIIPLLADNPQSCIIDFTSASASLTNAAAAAEKNVPIVIGATGFTNDQKMELAALATVTPILYSANMSVGINALMRILPVLAAALGGEYDIDMVELHHRHKKDAPSGTALMLADALAQARGWSLQSVKVTSRSGMTGERKKEEIGIQALRGGDVTGIHEIYFLGEGELIKVTHEAESRENFARGALRAAKWLSLKQAGPLYSMQDVIWNEATSTND